MALGENVGKLVAARGLSYGDVARGIKLEDPQAIWALVKRKSKKSDYAGKLAEFFKVPLHRLMADDFDVAEVHTPAPAVDYRIEEAEAITRLRRSHPDWRRYVLGLAMVDSPSAQELLLNTMRQAVPDYKVENAYGDAPHLQRKPLFSGSERNRPEVPDAKANRKTKRA